MPKVPVASIASIAELLNDTCHDQILAVSMERKVIAWNKACEEETGIPKEAALDKTLEEVLPCLANNPSLNTALEKAIKGQKAFVEREEDAERGTFHEYHFTPLQTEQASLNAGGVFISIHDVTHAVKAEDQLRELNERLELKNKDLEQRTAELSQFNEMAAEDLKEPLRKIYNFIEFVINRDGRMLSDKSRGKLRRAQSGVQRLGLMADDMLRFSQIAIAENPLTEVDLSAVHQQTMVAMQKGIQQAKATVQTGTLPAIVAYPDLMPHLWFYLMEMLLSAVHDSEAAEIFIRYADLSGADALLDEADASADYHVLTFAGRPAESGIVPSGGMAALIVRKVAAAHGGFLVVSNDIEGEVKFSCYLKLLTLSA